jgi:hypothetical protein
MIGFVIFVATFLTVHFCLSVFRAQMIMHCGSFDRFGASWIVLKSIYVGTIVALLWMSINSPFFKSGVFSLLLSALLISLDFILVPSINLTVLDRFIESIGYRISIAFPIMPKDTPIPEGFVSAIKPQTRIDASANGDTLSISAGHGLLRTISWDGESRSIELFPRELEPRIYGFLFPKTMYEETWPGDCWIEHDGITRCRYREGILKFKTSKDANAWIDKRSKSEWAFFSTGDGLTVLWLKDRRSRTFEIDVWQLMVGGIKPVL